MNLNIVCSKHQDFDLPTKNNTQTRKDEQRPAEVSERMHVLLMHIKKNISLLLRQFEGIPDSCETYCRSICDLTPA